MAWVKVSQYGRYGTQYCINTDKLIVFSRPEGAEYTNLWEQGDEEKEIDPRSVKETPDELLALIREAEGR